jgi:threonyl-tRNA synthetase
MLVVGAKEAENETVSFRDRLDGDQGAIPLSQAIERLSAERASRQSRQTAPPAPAVAVEDAAEDHTY